MVELANDAGRVELENSTSPQRPALPRADRDAMEEFLDPARILLAALGFPLLQPVVKKDKSGAQAAAGSTGPLADVRLFFNVPKRGVKAEGASTDEGFVVFAGSVGSKGFTKSLPKGWLGLRDDLVAKGAIEVSARVIHFKKDVLFKSPSAAAAVTAGTNRNGRLEWKDAKGKSLGELESELLVSADEDAASGDN